MKRAICTAICLFILSCATFCAQTPTPIPVTGNLSSILGNGQAYAGVSIQLLNCPSPVSIPGYSVIVQQGYQVQANPSGVVNTTVWSNDLINCNGTQGNSEYQLSYVANGAVQGTPQCYQVVSTQTWNLNTQSPIACTGSAPNPYGVSQIIAGSGVTISPTTGKGNVVINLTGGGGMIYPGAGIPNSSGSSWLTSYGVNGSGNVVLTTSPTLVTPTANTYNATTGYDINGTPFGTANLADWTNAGVVNGDCAVWNSGTSKWTPGSCGGSGTITLTGDVTGSGTGTIATSVVKVNGAAVPSSQGLVGTNGSGQIVAAGVPATNFKHWFTALGNTIAGISDTRVCMPGDSTFFGAYALPTAPSTSWATYGPDAQLANVFQSQYHILAQAASRFGSGSSVSISPSLLGDDPRFSVASQWTADTTTPVPGGYAMEATSAGDMAFTPVENIDTFTIHFLTGSGWGTFAAHIDGGSSTTQSTNGSPGIGTLVLTAGSVGVHTLHLTWSSGGVVKWWGAEGRDSTTHHVIFEQIGNSGATSANFSDTSNVWGAGESLPWSTLACDLVVQESGINDWNTSVPVATYKTNMQTTVTAQLAAGADVAEVSGNPSDTSQTGVTVATQLTYVTALQQVAAANSNAGLSTPLPFINNWQMFAGPVEAANYGYGYAQSFGQMAGIDGGLHPNLYGYYSSSVSIASGILTNPSTTNYQLQTFASNPYWKTGSSNVEVYFTDPPWWGHCDGTTDDHAALGNALYFYSSAFPSQTPGAFAVNLPYSYSSSQRTCLITGAVGVFGNNTLKGNGSIISYSGTGAALSVTGLQSSGSGQSIMRAKVQDLKVVLTAASGSVTGISATGNFQLDNVTVATNATPTSYTSLSVTDASAPPNGSVTNSSFDGPVSIDGSAGNGPDTQASLNFLNDKVGSGSTTMPSGNTSMVTVTNWRGGILNLNFPWMYNAWFPSSSTFFKITNTAATDFGSSAAININATPISDGGTPTLLTFSNSGGGSVPVVYGNIDTTGNNGGVTAISGSCNGVINIGNAIYENCAVLSGTGTVTTTGSPANPQLACFSGSTSITNCATAYATVAQLPSSISAGSHQFLTSYTASTETFTQAQPLCGDLSASSTTGTASSSTFCRGDGQWATPSGGGTTTNALTMNNGGSGAASGTTFNGSAAVTVSYNTLGAGGLAASNSWSGNQLFSATVTMGQLGIATSGGNFSSNIFYWQGDYWNGSAPVNDNWSMQNVLAATGSSPTSTLTFVHGGSSGIASVSIPYPTAVGNGSTATTQTTGDNTTKIATDAFVIANAGAGVTSVALSSATGNLFSTTPGTPVTASGTLDPDAQLKTQSANCVVAGPSSGSAAVPTCRTQVTADLPVGTVVSSTPAVGSSDTLNCSTGTGVQTFATTITRPAFTQVAGAMWKLIVTLAITTSGTPPTFLFEVEDGSNVVYSTAAGTFTVTSATNLVSSGEINQTIAVTGSSTTMYSGLTGLFPGVSSAANVQNRSPVLSSFNSTASATESVLFQCGTATGGNSATLIDLEYVKIR